MAVEIIGAGYGRTGTMSTYTALNSLGFPCYHMFELGTEGNEDHLDFWLEVARSTPGVQHDWSQVFANYRATIDNPASCVWRELVAANPDAKVLLTLHPKGAEAWCESTIDTIYFTENKWQFKIVEFFTPFGRKMGEMSRKLVWQRAHRGTMNDRTAAIAEYQRHIEEVKATVSPEKLLIFTADQGWEPLCKFLEVDVPEGEFPNVNDREQIKKTIAGMCKGAYFILAGLAAAAGVLGYGLSRLLA